MSQRNVSNMFERESIGTAQLEQLCEVLNYDFFRHFVRPEMQRPTQVEEPEIPYSGKEIAVRTLPLQKLQIHLTIDPNTNSVGGFHAMIVPDKV